MPSQPRGSTEWLRWVGRFRTIAMGWGGRLVSDVSFALILALMIFFQPAAGQVPLGVPTAQLQVASPAFSDVCPVTVKFVGTITLPAVLGGLVSVQYRFVRSDGTSGPITTARLGPGTVSVSDTWPLWEWQVDDGRQIWGRIGYTPYSGWDQVEIMSPLHAYSNRAGFQISHWPDSSIDIQTVADIQGKRDKLVQCIWGPNTTWGSVLKKQPTATLDHYVPLVCDALPAPAALSNLDRIEQIVIKMDLAGANGGRVMHTSTAYLFHPVVSNGRVVIVHHGHGHALDGSHDWDNDNANNYNLNITIGALLSAHYAVVGMRMPLLQNLQCPTNPPDSVTTHDYMFGNFCPNCGNGDPAQEV